MTSAALKQSPTAPPQPTAQSVRAHKQTLILARDALRATAPSIALESARGAFGAKDALANLGASLTAIEFEIELNDSAVALAMAEDSAREAAFRASIQELDPDEIVAGISKGGCCNLCVPGSYCVISGSVPHAAGTCSHPLLSKHLQHLDETGRRHFRYEQYPRAAALHKAASRKLGVSS